MYTKDFNFENFETFESKDKMNERLKEKNRIESTEEKEEKETEKPNRKRSSTRYHGIEYRIQIYIKCKYTVNRYVFRIASR